MSKGKKRRRRIAGLKESGELLDSEKGNRHYHKHLSAEAKKRKRSRRKMRKRSRS